MLDVVCVYITNGVGYKIIKKPKKKYSPDLILRVIDQNSDQAYGRAI